MRNFVCASALLFFIWYLNPLMIEAFPQDSTKEYASSLKNESVNVFSTCPTKRGCCQETDKESGIMINCIDAGLTVFPTNFPLYTDNIVLTLNHIDTLKRLNSSNKSDGNWNNVKKLNLTENEIENIDYDFFCDFIMLNTLILRKNDIKTLSWTAKLANTNLSILDLSHNKITSITNHSFGFLQHLYRLDLSHNSIITIGPDCFHSLFHLRRLDLASNELEVDTVYENAFSGLFHLDTLSLADNHKLIGLPEFKAIGLDKTRLETLDLHGLSQVEYIPALAFSGLNNLTALNLSFCGLKDLHVGWLDGGPDLSLKTLDLSHNNFETIRNHYFVATNVREFCTDVHDREDLSITQKRRLVKSKETQETYRNLDKLSWLSLSDNPNLAVFETNSFIFLPNVQYLFLQRCNLSKLNLPEYSIQYHEDAIRESFKRLRGIWLFGNPWHCDCHLRNVIDISVTYSDLNNATGARTPCKNPQNTSEEDVLYVDENRYFFDGECHTVGRRSWRTDCFPFSLDDEQYLLSDVPRSYLRCPDEPIVFFIAVILGPLSLVGAVLLILLCGFCTVFLSRIHRSYAATYNPKYYYQDWRLKKIASSKSKVRNQVYSPSRSHKDAPSHSMKLNRFSASAASTERPNKRAFFQTNMIMGNFSASLSSTHSQMPLLRPIPVLPNKRALSPLFKRSRKKNPRPGPMKGHSSENIDVELDTYCTNVNRVSTPSDWLQATPLSRSNTGTFSTNSFRTLKSDAVETPNMYSSSKRRSETNEPSHFSSSAKNFMPLPVKSQSIPSIHEPSPKCNSETDLCQITISESPTIPYIDEDANIKSAIERFVYQDPITRAIVPKNTLSPNVVIEGRPLLLGTEYGGNDINHRKGKQFLKKPSLHLHNADVDYYSS